MKAVDESECVRLQSNPRASHADSTADGCCPARRLAVECRGELGDRGIIEPVSALHVKSKQVRVQLLLNSDEVCHGRSADLPTEQTNNVEERRKRKRILRLRHAAGKNRLQDNGRHKPYKGERLTHSHEQLGAVEVCCRPCTGVMRVEYG